MIEQISKGGVTFGKKNGNGLGLKAAISWIEIWGGSLTLRSSKDVGTTLSINLPLTKTNARFISALPEYAAAGYVVVDDEPEIGRALLKKSNIDGAVFSSITAYGIWLGESSNAEGFLHVFDLHLKHGSGLDLLQSIPWPERAVLYTNDYLNEVALQICADLQVPILPKSFI